MGISWGVTAVAIGPILGALLLLKFGPETRGLTLEEIQQKLDGDAARARSQPLTTRSAPRQA